MYEQKLEMNSLKKTFMTSKHFKKQMKCVKAYIKE